MQDIQVIKQSIEAENSINPIIQIQYFGDAMYPYYSSGDILAIRKVNNMDCILWGETYFVVTDEEHNSMKILKTLHPNEKDNSSIILRSKNSYYQGDMIIPKTAILELYKVVGSISRQSA